MFVEDFMKLFKFTILVAFAALALASIGCKPKSVTASSGVGSSIKTGSVASAINLTASANPISLSGTTVISANVVDDLGNPVADGTPVSFTFDVGGNLKARMSSSNSKTVNGIATVTLTATSPTDAIVTVKAASSSATANIAITITSGGSAGTNTISITSNPASLIANNVATSTITATLRDQNNQPITNQTVNFSLNNTLATLSAVSVLTDSSGNATVTLRAGSIAGSVTVTASAQPVTVTASTSITLAASTGQNSITTTAASSSINTYGSTPITVLLISAAGAPVSNATVNFSVSPSSAATLSAATALTNANGIATVTMTAGTIVTPVTVTASFTGTIGGSPVNLSNATTVAITAPPPDSVSLQSNPTSITVFGTATLTATVTASGRPVPDGTPVNFVLTDTSSGELSITTAFTSNTNGTATTTFTAKGKAGSVTITVVAGNVSSATTIGVTPASAGSIQFISATPQVVGLKGSGQTETSIIQFFVKDINGNPATEGTAVSYFMKGPGGGAYIGPFDTTPNNATGSTVGGNSTVILSAGSAAGPVTIIASTDINSGSQTNLSAAIDASVTSIPVASTAGFPNIGRIRIDSELIDYNGTTATGFSNCTRAAVGTQTVSHVVNSQVFGQSTISSSASQVSIGGGLPSATHFNVARLPVNIPGLLWSGIPSDVSVYIADRFGNYNVLQGTAVSFTTEAGAIDRQNVTDDKGFTHVAFRTQAPDPANVAIAPWEVALINSLNVTYPGLAYPNDGSAGHPRNGWVTVVATVQGEESFEDANGNGIYDAGEKFTDISEPFVDKNDDGCRNDGVTKNCNGIVTPQVGVFEDFTDANLNGVYDAPNGVWDGPGCSGVNCQQSRLIWMPTLLAFTGNAQYCELSANTIGQLLYGTSQTFFFMVGDQNLNRLIPGTTIGVSATGGTLSGAVSYTLPDGVPVGPAEISFTLTAPQAPNPKVDAPVSLTVTVTPPEKVIGCVVTINGTFH